MPGDDGSRRVVLVIGDLEMASWPLRAARRPGLSEVEALARLQLEARRLGWSIRLCRPCGELCDLLALAGLEDVFPESTR